MVSEQSCAGLKPFACLLADHLSTFQAQETILAMTKGASVEHCMPSLSPAACFYGRMNGEAFMEDRQAKEAFQCRMMATSSACHPKLQARSRECWILWRRS